MNLYELIDFFETSWFKIIDKKEFAILLKHKLNNTYHEFFLFDTNSDYKDRFTKAEVKRWVAKNSESSEKFKIITEW